jgi:NAD(P)H-dependent FMN reductase
MKLSIILGSTREGRVGDKFSNWIKGRADSNAALKNAGIEVELIDLRDWAMPFFNSPTTPLSGIYPEGITQEWAKKIGESDGFVVVTPEYNHGYSAVLKNAFDVINKEWNYKPVVFVGYGWSAAGARAVEQLRQVVAELKMYGLRESILISMPSVMKEAGAIAIDDTTNKSADAMLAEIARWIPVMKKTREESTG